MVVGCGDCFKVAGNSALSARSDPPVRHESGAMLGNNLYRQLQARHLLRSHRTGFGICVVNQFTKHRDVIRGLELSG